MEMESFAFKPIGIVHSLQKYRFETPRQGAFASGDGVIEIFSEYAGDAIADLQGFDRIWVIFCFHLNSKHGWKPKVRPPFPADGPCRSVFATRSPYRVNPIGLSCVELAGIEEKKLLVRHIDMLDGTPVLDIKPYIPEADSFPDAVTGWRNCVQPAESMRWQLEFQEPFLKQAEFILLHAGLDLVNFAKVQLANEPFDVSRKRVKHVDGDRWILGCRTWQIGFAADMQNKKLILTEVKSNYSQEELLPGQEDKYNDKEIHRNFIHINNQPEKIL